jgi:hypothetical protein
MNNSNYLQLKKLACARGVSYKDLIVLTGANDPFYAGSKSNRVKAEWFADLWQRFGFTDGTHLRRIHYKLISMEGFKGPGGKPYLNTNNHWHLLGAGSRQARYLGLVSPESFIDRRNPEGHYYYQNESVNCDPSYEIDDLYWSIPRWNLEFADDDFSFDPPTATIIGYEYADSNQLYHIEIWCEKSTMNDILLPIGEKYSVNIITSVGYQSVTNVIGMCKRVAQYGKPTRIFYVSDFDPRGDSMPVAVARQVEFWLKQYADGTDIKLQPIILTEEQTKEYKLPRTPVKPSEKMKEKWEEKHDEGATELDALEALYPGVFKKIVEDAITPYRDMELEQELSDSADEAQDTVDNEIEEIWKKYDESLRKLAKEVIEVSAKYREETEPIKERYKKEMAPIEDQLQSYLENIDMELMQIDISLPERSEAECNEPNEDDYLFSSDRSYETQLGFYKERQE